MNEKEKRNKETIENTETDNKRVTDKNIRKLKNNKDRMEGSNSIIDLNT
jgi:hypothetical protein